MNSDCDTSRPSSETLTLPGASTWLVSLTNAIAFFAHVCDYFGSYTSTRSPRTANDPIGQQHVSPAATVTGCATE